MAYLSNDPRSGLASASSGANASSYGASEYANFYESPPQVQDALGKTWMTRGQNFLVAYSLLEAGARIRRNEQSQEHVILLHDDNMSLIVRAQGETLEDSGRSLIVVPPGDSEIEMLSPGRVVEVIPTVDEELNSMCVNAVSYVEPKPNVAPLVLWPEPVGGFKLRRYSIDVDPEPGRFGRIWRTTNLMVNYTEPRQGPRDVTKMSPHTHDDFEQGSLCLEGGFVHHLRWPWGTDSRQWQEDEHQICAGPSLAVIPPLIVHTSQQISQGVNQLVDLFGPPRVDFSNMEGWVLNADEYPMAE
ncbi:MAG: hypothetical protein HKL86_05205 [Acidimicrobiaceae bacterium]|nr:hypothetical protein [Acidimicrobiaceae bacterium]